MKSTVAMTLSLCLAVSSAWAKLPPLNDEAKAKAAEAAAKTAHNGKVEAFLLCKSQDKTAAAYYKSSKTSGKDTKPATTTPPCADPGAFVYTPAPPAAAASAVVTAAAPAAAAPAVPAKVPAKP